MKKEKTKTSINITIDPKVYDKIKDVENKSKYIEWLIMNYLNSLENEK